MPKDSKTTASKASEPTFEQKMQVITEVYEEYEDTLNQLYEEFLSKMSAIRKKDDIRKVASLKLKRQTFNVQS
jgi:hypothetical protein